LTEAHGGQTHRRKPPNKTLDKEDTMCYTVEAMPKNNKASFPHLTRKQLRELEKAKQLFHNYPNDMKRWRFPA
jgi:hypothetical protein